MRKTYTWLIVMILVVTGAYADITISGDARVRPRLDVVDRGEYGNQTSNFYYYYRARVLLSADIGDGYFFKTRIGHNWAAYYMIFGTNTTPIPGASLPSSGRGTLSFMELYLGHQNETYGWSGGIIPVAHNPLNDMHFYPTKMADLPWLIYNNASAPGFDFNYKVGTGKLDVKLLVDNNAGVKTSFDGEEIDSLTTRDQYSLDASYSLAVAGIKVTPEFLMTIADESHAAPMTYGAAVALPKVAGFGVSSYFGMTKQSVEDAGAYDGWIARAKIAGKVGPGALTAWYDIAAYTPDVDGAVTTNTNYLWVSYTYTLHKSDKGALTLAPTYRLYTQKTEGSQDYSRAKIEFTTQITFK